MDKHVVAMVLVIIAIVFTYGHAFNNISCPVAASRECDTIGRIFASLGSGIAFPLYWSAELQKKHD